MSSILTAYDSMMQGLANLLWAYSKMSVPIMDVMMMIVAEMANRLHSVEGVTQFDAQVGLRRRGMIHLDAHVGSWREGYDPL
jgi:hypothetical protein